MIVPAAPAAYVRAAAARSTDDPAITRQRDHVAAARALGWPEPGGSGPRAARSRWGSRNPPARVGQAAQAHQLDQRGGAGQLGRAWNPVLRELDGALVSGPWTFLSGPWTFWPSRSAGPMPIGTHRGRPVQLGRRSRLAPCGELRTVPQASPPPLLALARTPTRLVGAAALALLAVDLLAVAGHGGQVSLVPVACALALGYLAAAWLCEGARLDAEDTRRSEQLPFTFRSLAWWHAVVPCLVLLLVACVPVIPAAVAAGNPALIILLVVTVPVLVAGALVNVFRGEFAPDLFAGVDTIWGNTPGLGIDRHQPAYRSRAHRGRRAIR